MELQGRRVAILVEDNYAELELWYPVLRLHEAGAYVTVVGTGAAGYTSKHSMYVAADTSAEHVQVDDFDALLIPGAPSAQTMARHPVFAELVSTAIQQGKVVAAVSTAGQGLIVAHAPDDEGALRFFRMNEEVVQGDGPYKDSAVIRQGNLIMARSPVDLVAFCRMIIAALVEMPAPTIMFPPTANVTSPPGTGPSA